MRCDMTLRALVAILAVFLSLLPAVASPALPTHLTVADEFRGGVLGFSWGSSLDDVVKNFPPGVAWPITSRSIDPRGERYFAVPDDTPILGIKRIKQQTMFGFDYSNRLIQAIFSMPY